jgi:uncharacterized alkaline shock family protein YloU
MQDSAIPPEEISKKLNIIQVSYGLTVNTGNYEAVRFDLVAKVETGQKWPDVFSALKKKAEKIKQLILQETNTGAQ